MARPFQRGWKEERDFEMEGSEESHQLAIALAQISDPGFLRSIMEIKVALDRFGGEGYGLEFFVAADRGKFNARGEEVARGAGDFLTVGYGFHWNSRPQVTRPPEAEEPSSTREEVVAEVETAPNGETDPEQAQEAVESAAGS